VRSEQAESHAASISATAAWLLVAGPSRPTPTPTPRPRLLPDFEVRDDFDDPLPDEVLKRFET
jgi:hypothetical protein